MCTYVGSFSIGLYAMILCSDLYSVSKQKNVMLSYSNKLNLVNLLYELYWKG